MSVVGTWGIDSGRAIPSGVRVVVVEPDAAVRNSLRNAIDNAYSFVLAGMAHSWREGRELVEMYVPELLIARDGEVPVDAANRLTASGFPLLVSLSGAAAGTRVDSALATLALPLDKAAVTKMLDTARTEIYARKASELSQLLGRYLDAAQIPQQYLALLKVDDQGRTIEITTEEVVSIAADGNYVRVHTAGKTYEMRETMTGLREKLDPRNFVRVHRSFIVNLSHVQDVVDKAGASSLLVLHDGSEVPIGPNYRDEISGSVNRRLRLTA